MAFWPAAIASFSAQFWGNRKAEKVGAKVSSSTAAQTTVDEIRDRVIALEARVAQALRAGLVGEIGEPRPVAVGGFVPSADEAIERHSEMPDARAVHVTPESVEV